MAITIHKITCGSCGQILAYSKYRDFTIYCENGIRKFEKEGGLIIV